MKYTGSVYIGVVGSESAPIQAITSIVNIRKRDGDKGPLFYTGTKGYITRQMHINNFMESEQEFILLLDHDMIFQDDTLERLRNWEVPYVSGYYMRRQFAPMYSVWFHPFSGEWPFENYLDEPPVDRLVEIGASGWGCVLIHKDVITATRALLKGEPDVIEDDMDVWPYDLREVLAGKEQLRPLRVIKDDIVGSDIRFPFFAAHAGFPMYGDASVRPEHFINYPLKADDFAGQTLAANQKMKADGRQTIVEKRELIQIAWREVQS